MRPFQPPRPGTAPTSKATAPRHPLARPLVRVVVACLALGAAGAVAQTDAAAPGTPPAASPTAPPSVVAPPRPTPGDGQSAVLRDRLVVQAFEQADRNRDGQLSQEEAASMPGLPQRFDKVDRNNDGQVSREELRAAGGP